jgi:hypothetical protein
VKRRKTKYSKGKTYLFGLKKNLYSGMKKTDIYLTEIDI